MNGSKYYNKLFTTAGMQIGISGVLYYRQVSYSTYLFLEKFSRKWVFWREIFLDNRFNNRLPGYKLIFENNNVEHMARRVNSYIT